MSQQLKQYSAYGVRVEIAAEDDAVLEAVAARLPVGTEESECNDVDARYRISRDGSRSKYVLEVDGALVAGPSDLSDVLEHCESHIMLFVAEHAPEHVFVHAGVVAWRGRGIVLPGYSFAGKTTLVAELVRAGATYFSDEYALFDREGLVHPFPRPLQMRNPGRHEQERLTVAELGGTAGTEPVAVNFIIFCTYDPAAHWQMTGLSPARAALEMFQYTMCAQHAPESALRTLGRVSAAATLLKGTRGETAEAIRFILKMADA